MKVNIELDWKSIPKSGYTYYDMCPKRLVKKYCRWWSYPVFALYKRIYYKKLWIYHTLNDIGIMHTPEGCIMQLSDIWKRR